MSALNAVAVQRLLLHTDRELRGAKHTAEGLRCLLRPLSDAYAAGWADISITSPIDGSPLLLAQLHYRLSAELEALEEAEESEE